MTRLPRLLQAAVGCIALASTALAGPAPSASVEPQRYATAAELFDAYFRFKLRTNPLEATSLGVKGYDDQIANYLSPEYQRELRQGFRGFLAAIASVERGPLSEADAQSLAVMRWECAIRLEGLDNALVTVVSPLFGLPNFELLPVTQIFSFNLYVGQLASGESIQPFATVEDYEHWLRRVADYLAWLETARANMAAGAARGVVWPRVIVERTIHQFDEVSSENLHEHLYYRPILRMPAAFPAVDRERLAAAYARMVREEVDPAHRRFRDFLANDYLPKAGSHTGLGALPGGDAAYRYLVRYHTGSELGPDEIHALGLREVARLLGEMDAVRRRVGFEGDLQAFFAHLRSDPALKPFTAPEQVIANFEAIHARMKPQLGRLFDLQPKAGFEVRRTEAFREASASAEYVGGSQDGSRPGVFYVPIPDVRRYSTLGDEALFLHEAIPGHHYQVSLQQENPALPEFLRAEGLGVFVEGWALYAESLGRELGLYQDPYQYFGMLDAEMRRAIRLVVDTGMHAKGWSREQAIRYTLEHSARSEASAVAEIERYMVAPAQALAYKIGQLAILELRARAERELGPDFDLREFHRQVLGSGSLPLQLLEAKIGRWIERQRSSEAPEAGAQ